MILRGYLPVCFVAWGTLFRYTDFVLFLKFLFSAAGARVAAFFTHWHLDAFRFVYSLTHRSISRLDDRLLLLASLARFTGAFRDEPNVTNAFPRLFVAGAAFSATVALYTLILAVGFLAFLLWAALPLYALYKVVFELVWMYW